MFTLERTGVPRGVSLESGQARGFVDAQGRARNRGLFARWHVYVGEGVATRESAANAMPRCGPCKLARCSRQRERPTHDVRGRTSASGRRFRLFCPRRFGRGRGPQMLERRRNAVEEGVDLQGDLAFEVVGNRQPVNPFAHANIENAGVQAPDQFEIGRALLRIVRGFHAVCLANLVHHGDEHALAQAREVFRVDAFLCQPRENENANPLAAQDDLGIAVIKRDHALLNGNRAVENQLFPRRVPLVDLVVHAVDERFLAGEIAVEQGLRDPELARQFARAARKTVRGEVVDGLEQDLPLAHFRRKAARRGGLRLRRRGSLRFLSRHAGSPLVASWGSYKDCPPMASGPHAAPSRTRERALMKDAAPAWPECPRRAPRASR
ncbi:hypothetical protein PT2222_360008 [Paraburkholderia tropica]